MKSFLDELRRRRVVRVAVVYGAVAFAALQVADLTFPLLRLPDWGVTLVLMLALLGLPVALVLAWAFDLTPEGVRRTEEEAHAHGAPTGGSRWLSGGTVAVVVGALALGGVAGWAAGRGMGPSRGAAASAHAARSSIAVLPFVNMGGNVDDEYFSDGLAEELLNLLARVEGLSVAARTSAFAFKGRSLDVRAIGDSLGVATVLEGSVRRDGERVRVTAQLIDVDDGYHLWSESFDAELSGIFEVQERIARAIASALEVELRAGLATGPTPDVAAHDLYLLGLSRFHERGPGVREAIGYFQRAVEADPEYAEAWAGLAMAYAVLPAYESADLAASGRASRAAAGRAMALDDALAEPYAAVCQVAAYVDWRWEEAERACDEAVARNPNSATAHQWRGEVMLILRRLEEAERSLSKAIALDPLSLVGRLTWSAVPWAAGDLAEAERRFRLTMTMDAYGPVQGVVLALLVQRGDTAGVRDLLSAADPEAAQMAPLVMAARQDPAARALVLSVWEAQPPPPTPAAGLNVAAGRALVGEDEGALILLEEALEERVFNLPLYYTLPTFDPLRGNPRFVEIGRAMGIVP